MLNILYAGSPDVAVVPLQKLAEAAAHSGIFRVTGVLTNPPTAQGRSKALVPTPVALAADEIARYYGWNVPVITPERLDATARETVAQTKPDLLVCFAYGRLFGPKFMELFPLGGINLHPSLLPKYRGCAPVPAAILNMEQKTGVSIQRIAQQMDSGDILAQTEVPLDGTETADDLLEHLVELGARLLVEVVLQTAKAGRIPDGTQQDEAVATFSTMLRKEDGLIDWNRSAKEIDAQIRAFHPWPGTHTISSGISLKIHEAYVYTSQDGACATGTANAIVPGTVLGTDKNAGILVQTGDGVLCVQRLQWQAKKAVTWNEFMNGSRNFAGTVLGR